MKAMFSTQQEKARKLSYAGRTVVGVVAALALSVLSVTGMSQQTGTNPAHWSINAAQGNVAPPVAVKKVENIQLASR